VKTTFTSPSSTEISHRLAYRPEIDGLRAVAVLSVVFFHANLGCPGGFVGVDVFFVLSGFLITSLILKDLRNGVFSFSEFWERRARRILPALCVLVAAVLVAGWFTLLPHELEKLGRSVFALTLFCANIFFWRDANNYFADAAEESPLLHTWSLAVEEQFYFIIPFVLWGMFRVSFLRSRASLLGMLVAGFLISLGLSVYGVVSYPAATFYLLPTRAWELLTGAIVAQIYSALPLSYFDSSAREAKRFDRWIAECGAAIGLSGILLPVFLYDSRTPFPGLAALPPCLGTALIIWTKSWRPDVSTQVSKLLSCRPMIFVGLISYSFYLWHWPPIVFYRLFAFQAPTVSHGVLLVLLGLICAVLSWKFVETPFRKKQVGQSQRVIFAYSGMSLFLLSSVGACFVVTNGVPGRVPADAMRLAAAASDAPPTGRVDHESLLAGNVPVIGDASALRDPVMILWGDSHAGMLVPAFDEFLREQRLYGFKLTYPATPPVLGWIRPNSNLSAVKKSDKYNKDAVEYIRKCSVPIVVFAGFWTMYAKDREFNGIELEEALLLAVKDVKASGAEPWVFMDVPIPLMDVPKYLSRTTAYPDWCRQKDCFATVAGTDPFDLMSPSIVDRLKAAGARVIDPKPAFLDPTGTFYVVEKDGDVLYRDDDHLSGKGAVRMILPLLREAWADYQAERSAAAPGSAAP